MKRGTKWIATAAVVSAAVVGGARLAGASGGDDTEAPIRGSDLDRASAAALEHTGEGRVTGTEVGDEESYYEVEVTLPGGQQIDVQLDRSFEVVGDAPDREGAEEADEGR